MGDRLSDERLSALIDCVNSSPVTTASNNAMRDVLTELKERRAADLTAEEREALEWAKACVMCDDEQTPLQLRALSALSKILKDGT
jgi:DNA-directed RNA polymerase subunit F